MGSWNETCKLTNLPVKHHDPVVLIVVAEKQHRYGGGTFVESDGFYAPMSFPIYGEYSDYGTIENITTPKSVEFFKKFIENERLKDRIIYDDDEPFDIDSVLDYVERGYLKMGRDFDDDKELSYIFMHRHAYDKLISLQAARVPYNSTITSAEEYTKLFTHRQSKIMKMTATEKCYYMMVDDYRIEMFGNVYLNILIADRFYDKGEDYLKELVELNVLRDAFSFGRYSWIPMCGRGSQDSDLHIASEMAKATLEYIQKEYDSYIEEDSEPVSMEEYVCSTPFMHSRLWEIE